MSRCVWRRRRSPAAPHARPRAATTPSVSKNSSACPIFYPFLNVCQLDVAHARTLDQRKSFGKLLSYFGHLQADPRGKARQLDERFARDCIDHTEKDRKSTRLNSSP